MPAGDPQRTWFPEMVEELRRRCRMGMSFTELVELRDQLDAMLHQIRSERHISTPVIRCPRCGHVGPAAEPDVSVRAMILAVGRFGVGPVEHVKALEKRWAAHRREYGFDLHGRAAGTTTTALACSHRSGRE
jgi:hypothetical protein